MRIKFKLLVILLSYFIATSVLAQDITLKIDQIEENQFISGIVEGLPSGGSGNYKVVIYVHTDQWYIHPYAGSKKGQSWAGISPEGVWKILTIRREFSADMIAALAVPIEYKQPSRIQNIGAIENIAVEVINLKGTLDYGKL